MPAPPREPFSTLSPSRVRFSAAPFTSSMAAVVAYQALLPGPEAYLSFTAGGLDIRLFYSEVAYISSSGHSTVVSAVSGREYTVYTGFSAFTKPLLEKGDFLLISRGILVNMEQISGFRDNQCLLQNGVCLPVTVRKQKQLAQAWHNYNFAKFHRGLSERS